MRYFKIILILFLGIFGLHISSELKAQTATNLFKRDTSLSRISILDNPTGGAILIVDKSIIDELIATQPDDLVIGLPDEIGGTLPLILKKRTLFTSDFRAIDHQNQAGSIPMLDLHYMGYVENQPDSKVSLSITEGEVSGLIQMADRTVAIRGLKEENEHVVYNYEKHPKTPELDCSSTDTLPSYEPKKLNRTTENQTPVCVSIRVEVDQDFVGDPAALMNQVAMIYESINVNLQIAEIYYWTTPSPYTGSTREIISKLQESVARYSDPSGDITLLLSGKGNGGRAASVGLLCEANAVCYSGQNDDVYTAAHELGHLLAAHHTHACKWNGNNTSLDGCGFNAGYGGCAGEDPIEGGTLMSYCHIRSVGINLNFHPQVAKVIYNFVQDNSDCTCGAVEEEIEFELEEEVEIDGGSSNIIANICEIEINNSQSCAIQIYAMSNSKPTELVTSVTGNQTYKTPIMKSVTYGIFANGELVQTFIGVCGGSVTVNSCGAVDSRVRGKVFLEGFYDSFYETMHQKLVQQNIVTVANPYQDQPWAYNKATKITSIPTEAVDWILIMSRDINGNVLDQAVGFINKEGALIDLIGNVGIPLKQSTNNYISIHHRGHMAVMAINPYQAGSVYDFSTGENRVMGNKQLKLVGKKYVLHAGDFDANGVINNQDYNQWVSKSSKINEYITADGDGNGVVNNKDYNLWISNRSKIGYMPLQY